ncbi:MAG: glycosyltransferase [Calditrichaeota bacterium]|nr:glycosyltransferase [Calditrichota bacterium]
MDQKYRKYSVIIPSYNRADEIKELLTSLARLQFPSERFEVIVADDGSTDETESIVKEARENYSFELKYFVQKNQGPGAARNLGMKNAAGDFFIFIDSDVTVPQNWLTNIDKALHEQNGDAFGGPDTYRKDFPPLLKAINYSMTSFLTTGGLRGKKGKKLARFYPRSFNMGLSRALWEKIGGFSSLRHGQDIEFSNRIINSGAKVVFVHDAPVYHKRRTNLRRFFKQVFNWGVARINLYKIDSRMLELVHALPAFATLFTLLIIVLAVLWTPARILLQIGLYGGILLILVSMIDAVFKYKEIKPALYLPIVIPSQIFGYGLGFIYNFIRRVILKKSAKVGFHKNYYK